MSLTVRKAREAVALKVVLSRRSTRWKACELTSGGVAGVFYIRWKDISEGEGRLRQGPQDSGAARDEEK